MDSPTVATEDSKRERLCALSGSLITMVTKGSMIRFVWTVCGRDCFRASTEKRQKLDLAAVYWTAKLLGLYDAGRHFLHHSSAFPNFLA